MAHAAAPRSNSKRPAPRPNSNLPATRRWLRPPLKWFNPRTAVAAVALLAAVAAAAPLPVQVTPSVTLLGEFDWVPYPDGDGSTSRCTDMVDRVHATGATRLHLVPTHYYWQDDRTRKLTGFCFMDTSYQQCRSFDQAGIDSFRQGVAKCMSYAVQRGFSSVALTPRVDRADTGREWTIRSWRNGAVFAPMARYGGYSYEEVMLHPLADALGGAIPEWMPVYFALQGEMGATVFAQPRDWASLLRSVPARISAARGRVAAASSDAIGSGNVKMGLTFNFVYVDGNASPNNQVAARRSFGIFGLLGANTLAARFLGLSGGRSNAPEWDPDAVRSLLREGPLAFVGVSAYAPLPVGFSGAELQNSMFEFMGELESIVGGTDLAGRAARGDMELQYAEFGVGGGGGDNGDAFASGAEQAVRQPFWGIYGPYTYGSDPWRVPELRAVMRRFWTTAAEWLAGGGGPTYHVTACYAWSLASWDVLGIYPESTTSEGTYRDDTIASMVAEHNRAVTLQLSNA